MIILNYPKYVGGKFISNCIALSRHCVAQNKHIAKVDLEATAFDKEYYDFKLQSVLRTLPEKTQVRLWSRFEFGCKQLYDIDEVYYQDRGIADIKQYLNDHSLYQTILSKNRQSCVIAHEYQTFMKYLIVHPTARIIEFSNFDQFRKAAALMKDPNPAHVEDEDYVRGADFYHRMREFYQLESYTVDVDGTFFDWGRFDPMMRGLYDYLAFDDYQPDLVKQFWTRYAELHQ